MPSSIIGFLLLLYFIRRRELKLRDESHLSIALQLRYGTAWEVSPTSVISTLFGGPLVCHSAQHPGTQWFRLTGYLLYLFTEVGFAPHVIEPGWGFWTQFQRAWVFPYQQVILLPTSCPEFLSADIVLETEPSPAGEGLSPTRPPPSGCCLETCVLPALWTDWLLNQAAPDPLLGVSQFARMALQELRSPFYSLFSGY